MGGIIRDVLDKQLVDRQQRKMGKVDGLIVELRDGQPPRLAYITVGGTTLARRLHPRLAQWLAMLARRWGIGRGEPFDKAGGYAVQDQRFRPVALWRGMPICWRRKGVNGLRRGEGFAHADGMITMVVGTNRPGSRARAAHIPPT